MTDRMEGVRTFLPLVLVGILSCAGMGAAPVEAGTPLPGASPGITLPKISVGIGLPEAGLPVPSARQTGPARTQPSRLGRISLGLDEAKGPQEVSSALQVMLLLTVLALAPSLLIMLTSFSRIVIVLGLLRQALGTPQMPPTQVLIGLALFLTAFVMAPVVTEVRDKAYTPYLAKQITQEEALDRGLRPIRQFMFRQTREQDLALMVQMAATPRPRTRDDVATHILIPAFIMSEMKSGFQMGFALFLPFIVIDFVVASVLLSMGMLFLPPATIALPFKLLLFVLADGWHLVVRSLVMSFQ